MSSNISKHCSTRLQKEYRSLLKEPVPNITAHPASGNILEWHFVLEGASDSEYEGGVYHGKLTFPPQYPFKPPSICVTTPNGRFATNTRLCLSMTDFHPETWNPMWRVGTILTGLLSFMSDSQQTAGSIEASEAERRRLAKESLEYNIKKNPMFRKLFPEWVEIYNKREQEKKNGGGAIPATVTGVSSFPPQGAQGGQPGVSETLRAMGVQGGEDGAASSGQAQGTGSSSGEDGVVDKSTTLGNNRTREINANAGAGEGVAGEAVAGGGVAGGGFGSSRLVVLAVGVVLLAVVLTPIYAQGWRQWLRLPPTE